MQEGGKNKQFNLMSDYAIATNLGEKIQQS